MPAASQEESITVLESQPPAGPADSTRSKGRKPIHHSQAESSTAVPQIIPSSFIAVNKDTPGGNVANDNTDNHSGSEGIQRLPNDLKSAREEIAALRAANQELRQRSAATGKRGGRRQGRGQSTRNQGQKHFSGWNHQRHSQNKAPGGLPNSNLGTLIRGPQFHQRPPPTTF